MTNFSVSSIEELNAAIENQNPFAKPPFLNAKDIWDKEFLDIETINSHASEAVFQALKQIQTGQYSTTSIAITAQDGTGKTHIISRIRHRLQSQGGALFVYANKYGDISQIKQGFQSILADSLKKIGSKEVMQWQELATDMVNEALKAVNPKNKTFLPKDLLQQIEETEESKPEVFNKWLNNAAKAFCKIKNVNNPDTVRAILWTLSADKNLFAINWLAGKELAQFKANELGLPTQNQSFDAVLQILDLISEYNQLVICFDELDNPDIDPDTSLTRAQVVAGLIKELFENLKQGIILSVMMPGVWSNKVKALPGGVYNKISAQGSPLELKYPDGNSIIQLVTLYLREFYKAKNLVPPNPTYPFTQNQLTDLADDKPTIREVLKWCRDNCVPGVEQLDPVEIAFSKEMEEELGNSLDDNYLVANALLFGFQRLIGKTVERVTIEQVTDRVKKRGGKDDYINFKIIGNETGKNATIGVAVLQYTGGKTLGAGLRRLNDYETFGLTRGCLVRSKGKKITPHMEKTYLEPLVRQNGGEVVPLKEEEIKPLIAIYSVYQKREVDYKVTDLQIFNFIAEKGAEKMLGVSNPLVQEILSDPSYEVPADMIEEEPVVSEEYMIADVSESDNQEILSDPSYEVAADRIEEEPTVSEESMIADVSESRNMDDGINALFNRING
ncbi:AAA family ATPase [Microcoleus sp. FACHB-831]|uniref:AAA family ATPase n=1 Tax=Microcoleus sp. FACHB-831 TaxID=2692827 RepID=UPI0016826E04|nr:AAA family ATPase [Microcoleus sp. FACHB-831]MBD1921575.1 AAA family ATPase [Microcoleus sp. FACHB-831]